MQNHHSSHINSSSSSSSCENIFLVDVTTDKKNNGMVIHTAHVFTFEPLSLIKHYNNNNNNNNNNKSAAAAVEKNTNEKFSTSSQDIKILGNWNKRKFNLSFSKEIKTSNEAKEFLNKIFNETLSSIERKNDKDSFYYNYRIVVPEDNFNLYMSLEDPVKNIKVVKRRIIIQEENNNNNNNTNQIINKKKHDDEKESFTTTTTTTITTTTRRVKKEVNIIEKNIEENKKKENDLTTLKDKKGSNSAADFIDLVVKEKSQNKSNKVEDDHLTSSSSSLPKPDIKLEEKKKLIENSIHELLKKKNNDDDEYEYKYINKDLPEIIVIGNLVEESLIFYQTETFCPNNINTDYKDCLTYNSVHYKKHFKKLNKLEGTHSIHEDLKNILKDINFYHVNEKKIIIAFFTNLEIIIDYDEFKFEANYGGYNLNDINLINAGDQSCNEGGCDLAEKILWLFGGVYKNTYLQIFKTNVIYTEEISLLKENLLFINNNNNNNIPPNIIIIEGLIKINDDDDGTIITEAKVFSDEYQGTYCNSINNFYNYRSKDCFFHNSKSYKFIKNINKTDNNKFKKSNLKEIIKEIKNENKKKKLNIYWFTNDDKNNNDKFIKADDDDNGLKIEVFPILTNISNGDIATLKDKLNEEEAFFNNPDIIVIGELNDEEKKKKIFYNNNNYYKQFDNNDDDENFDNQIKNNEEIKEDGKLKLKYLNDQIIKSSLDKNLKKNIIIHWFPTTTTTTSTFNIMFNNYYNKSFNGYYYNLSIFSLKNAINEICSSTKDKINCENFKKFSNFFSFGKDKALLKIIYQNNKNNNNNIQMQMQKDSSFPPLSMNLVSSLKMKEKILPGTLAHANLDNVFLNAGTNCNNNNNNNIQSSVAISNQISVIPINYFMVLIIIVFLMKFI